MLTRGKSYWKSPVDKTLGCRVSLVNDVGVCVYMRENECVRYICTINTRIILHMSVTHIMLVECGKMLYEITRGKSIVNTRLIEFE